MLQVRLGRRHLNSMARWPPLSNAGCRVGPAGGRAMPACLHASHLNLTSSSIPLLLHTTDCGI